MVPGDDDLVPVRLMGQPCQLRLDLGEGAPLGEIPSVEEEIAGWKGRLCAVSVGDADNGDGVCWGWR